MYVNSNFDEMKDDARVNYYARNLLIKSGDRIRAFALEIVSETDTFYTCNFHYIKTGEKTWSYNGSKRYQKKLFQKAIAHKHIHLRDDISQAKLLLLTDRMKEKVSTVVSEIKIPFSVGDVITGDLVRGLSVCEPVRITKITKLYAVVYNLMSHETEKIYKKWLKPGKTRHELINLSEYKKQVFEKIENHHWDWESGYDQDFCYNEVDALRRKERAIMEWSNMFSREGI